MSYRCNPIEDTQVVPLPRAGPRAAHARQARSPNSALLIDATMKHPMPPLALPKTRVHGERQGAVGEARPAGAAGRRAPWHGYSLGDWTEEWDRNAMKAARGEWMERDEILSPAAPARASRRIRRRAPSKAAMTRPNS